MPIMSWLPRASLVAIAITIVLGTSSFLPPLLHNTARSVAVRDLGECLDFTEVSKIVGFWLGRPTLPCAQRIMQTDEADIAFVWAWLSGTVGPSEQLVKIQPEERRVIFAWRNMSSLKPFAQATINNSLSTFLAHLAVDTWNHGMHTDGMRLATEALRTTDAQDAARILDVGIGVYSADDTDTITQLRRAIGQAFPNYVPNYENWFEGMVQRNDWESADEACGNLQRFAVSLNHRSLALVCSAQLHYYTGDYETAYRKLTHIAAQHPHDAMVLTWLGINAKMLSKFEKAQAMFTQAMRYEENSAAFLNLYWQVGDCQRSLGRWDDAIESYRTAIGYAPTVESRRLHESLLDQIVLLHGRK